MHENPSVLTRQDWRGPKAGWGARDLGHWEVRVDAPPGTGSAVGASPLGPAAGRYDILMRFGKPEGGGKATFELGELSLERALPDGGEAVTFEDVELPLGPGRVAPRIEDSKGAYGVHQVEILRRG